MATMAHAGCLTSAAAAPAVAAATGRAAECRASGSATSGVRLGLSHNARNQASRSLTKLQARRPGSVRVRPGQARAIGTAFGGSGEEEQKAAPGDTVRVVAPVIVYHVPKTPELNLEGKEGVVKEVLGVWKGVEISANLPYRTQFEVEVNGAPVKFFAHLKADEFQKA